MGSSLLRTLAVPAAVAVGVACTSSPPPPPPAPASATTVVDSDCPPDRPFRETIASTADPANPSPGATVRFTLQVRRLQIDIGPMREGRYWFPVPAGVEQVTGVEFGDDNPNTWAVQGTDLNVRFKAAEGDWLANDFPPVTVVARLSGALRPGDTVAWKPYRRFEQQFVNVERPLTCTVGDPAQVLQEMTITKR